MDFDLSDEQQLVRETARAFTDNEIVGRARDNARSGHFDLELVGKLAAQGYLGAIVPPEYGGAGLDHLTYALVVEEIGRGDGAMRTVVSVQTSLVCGSILRWGSEAQKRHYLPRLCSGEWLGCFGLTEPEAGSDAASQRTRATRVDGGWRLNGAKMWISLGNVARVALIFAQTDPEQGHRGLACFLVDTEDPGYASQEIEHKMGLHGSDTAAISLDDVFVPDDAVLGEVGRGFKIAMSALDGGRYSVAAGCVGVCQGCARRVGRLRQAARAVRQADRELSARAGDARRDARAHRRRPAARLARRRAARPGPPVHDGDLDREAVRDRGGGVVRERGDPGPRRRRLRRRPSGRALVSRRARHDALRGHVADPEAHHRPRADRHRRAHALANLTNRVARAFRCVVAHLPPFQRFLDTHREDVLRFLIASLGRHDADDAFQETFLSALRSYERLRPDSNLRGWVLTIAHRKALDVHRARARRPLPVAELHDGAAPACVRRPAPAPPDGDASSDHWERVRALPPRQRAVLTLRYAADLTHAEIAAALDCSIEAARRAASDGLKTLREELSDVPAST